MITNATEKLLGCPHCGGSAEFMNDRGYVVLRIWHEKNCFALLDGHDNYSIYFHPKDFGGFEKAVEEITARWNKRIN